MWKRKNLNCHVLRQEMRAQVRGLFKIRSQASERFVNRSEKMNLEASAVKKLYKQHNLPLKTHNNKLFTSTSSPLNCLLTSDL